MNPDPAPIDMLLHPYVNGVSCRGVLDSPQVAPQAVPLLLACAGRVAKSASIIRARRPRERLTGRDLHSLLRHLLFIKVEGAGGAARFANGDYSGLEAVLPVVDRVAEAVVGSPGGTEAFVTLCERASESFPTRRFVDRVHGLIEAHGAAPLEWLGTGTPGRLAALVHEFAQRDHPLPADLSRRMLSILDALVDLGDRRSAALQSSEVFCDVRLV